VTDLAFIGIQAKNAFIGKVNGLAENFGVCSSRFVRNKYSSVVWFSSYPNT
jgi:hypothetical protein